MDEITQLSSFRDPAGRVFCSEGRVIRVVAGHGRSSLDAFNESSVIRAFTSSGRFVATRVLQLADIPRSPNFAAVREFLSGNSDGSVLEHEAVPFPSYPCEWSPDLLYAAGCLTLDLCEALLDEGFGLKDATPSNVLFRGSQSVFIDVLSIEKRRPDDPVWLPYAQFVSTFVLPLLSARRWGTSVSEVFVGNRNGLQPNDVYKRCGVAERFYPSLLGLVSIPTWMDSSKASNSSTSIYRQHRSTSAEQAQFVLKQTFRRLRRKLDRVAPTVRRSTWSEYASKNTYSGSQADEKTEFVRCLMKTYAPKWVLDIGCNTGQFSLLAARHGANVVAIDSDQECSSAVFRSASEHGLPVLPLVVDISRPTPAMGWNNSEYASFLSRAEGKFNAVFMLAILHHLLVMERVPLPLIVDLAARLTKDILLIEYVGFNDPMFQQLLRGRQELHADFTRESFEQACRRRFHIVDSKQVQTERWLYLLRRGA